MFFWPAPATIAGDSPVDARARSVKREQGTKRSSEEWHQFPAAIPRTWKITPHIKNANGFSVRIILVRAAPQVSLLYKRHGL